MYNNISKSYSKSFFTLPVGTQQALTTSSESCLNIGKMLTPINSGKVLNPVNIGKALNPVNIGKVLNPVNI